MQEEVYWKQRSHIQQLKEMDENTKFFHVIANRCKNHNFILFLNQDGVIIVDSCEIGRMFSAHFKQQFGEKHSARLRSICSGLFSIRHLLTYPLLKSHSPLRKLRNYLLTGERQSASPNGFPIHFFKQFWESINADLFQLFEDFFFHRANLEKINWANINPIPKVDSPDCPGDYRPISLINSLKIISMLLASRLSKVINDLVDTEQLAFLKGRCILDNIATAEELIFSIHK